MGFNARQVPILAYCSYDDGLYGTKLNVPAEKDNCRQGNTGV